MQVTFLSGLCIADCSHCTNHITRTHAIACADLQILSQALIHGLFAVCQVDDDRTAMLCVNLLAWNFSSIRLMLIAALVSLSIFIVGEKKQRGGDRK